MTEVQIDRCCKEAELRYYKEESIAYDDLVRLNEKLIMMAGLQKCTPDRYGVCVAVELKGEILGDDDMGSQLVRLAADCPDEGKVAFDVEVAADGSLSTEAILTYEGIPLNPEVILKASSIRCSDGKA